jgi:hypothetical protein
MGVLGNVDAKLGEECGEFKRITVPRIAEELQRNMIGPVRDLFIQALDQFLNRAPTCLLSGHAAYAFFKRFNACSYHNPAQVPNRGSIRLSAERLELHHTFLRNAMLFRE